MGLHRGEKKTEGREDGKRICALSSLSSVGGMRFREEGRGGFRLKSAKLLFDPYLARFVIVRGGGKKKIKKEGDEASFEVFFSAVM